MRGTVAKRIRKYVRDKYKFLSDEPLHVKHNVTGEISLAQQCKRHYQQAIKREYKRRKKYGDTASA